MHDLEKANRLLAELVDVFTPGDDSRSGRSPYALTFAVAPVIPADRKTKS
jgi:hypothetical protein